jgi:hypothetical protein
MARMKALENIAFSYNGTALEAHMNSFQDENGVEIVDTTTFASTGQQQAPGAPNYSFSIAGPYSKAVDDVFRPDLISPPDTLRTIVASVGPTGSKVTKTWTGSDAVGGFVSSYTRSADNPLGDVTWQATITMSGIPTVTTS